MDKNYVQIWREKRSGSPEFHTCGINLMHVAECLIQIKEDYRNLHSLHYWNFQTLAIKQTAMYVIQHSYTCHACQL